MDSQLKEDGPPRAANVLIFRTALLGYSETFIPAQAEKLTKFVPYYAGFIAVNEISLPDERTLRPSAHSFAGKARDAAAIFGVLDPQFFREIRALRPRLVHSHFEEGGIKALPIVERLNIPLVTTCHGYDVTVEDYRWRRYPGLGAYYQKRRRDFFSRGNLFLGISRFICDQMLRRGYPKEKVRLHYIGVDTDRFAPNPSTLRKPYVLFVGRLVEKKGGEDLIRAMSQVVGKHPGIDLVIIGDGPLKSHLEGLARELRVPARFLGSQPAELVRDTVAEAMLLCNPSVRSRSGDSEGLGIVFLEAMAVGTPVVATRHGGIPEAVEDGVTGLLCAERNPAELAEAIRTLLADDKLRAHMGAAGRARVLEHFDLGKQTRLLEGMYEELLD